MHGTGIGVARSSDGGASWRYQGTVDGLVPPGTELPATPLLVYFTHPYWGGEDIGTMAPDPRTHLSHVRAAVLEVRDGALVCVEH